MSTSTLLIVSAAFRSHGAARINRPVPPVSLSGRNRALTLFSRNFGIASACLTSGSPKDGRRAAILEAGADHGRQHLISPAGAALAHGQRPLTLFPNPRAGSRQFLRRAVAAGSPDVPLFGRASLALVCMSLIVLAGSAEAQTSASDQAPPAGVLQLDPAEVRARESQRIGGSAPEPCVIVDVQGTRAGHLDCATGRLQEAARAAQAESRAGLDVRVPSATSADVETGVAHQATTRLRMGSGLGNSVHPERPATRPPRGARP